MKTTIKTIFFTFLICNGLFGQTNIGANIDSDLSVANIRAYSIGTFDNRETSYEGSPLLWKDWMYGTILLQGNKKYSDKEYRFNYNALDNVLYIRINNNIYEMLLNKVSCLNVLTGINVTSEYKVLSGKNSNVGLYEVLYSNENLELIRSTEIEMQKPYYNAALDAGDVRPSLKRTDILYISRNGELYELPKKRKKLVSKYNQTREMKDIVSFFDKNRVDLKNDEEVRSALIDFNKNK